MLYSAKKIHSQLDLKVGFGNWSADFLCRYNCEKVRTSWTSIDYILDENSAIDAITRGQHKLYSQFRKLKKGGLDDLKRAIIYGKIKQLLTMSTYNGSGTGANNSNTVPQIFSNDQFGQVRIIMQDNWKPLFCLKDACDCCDLGNPSMVAKRLDDDDLNSIEVVDSIGKKQEMLFVTESGLYDAVLGARNNPKTKPFKKWVTKEVLPSIRQTGSYSVEPNLSMRQIALQLAKCPVQIQDLVNEQSNLIGELQEDKNKLGQEVIFLQETVSNLEEELDEAGNKIEKKGEEFPIYDSAPRYYAPIGKQFFKSNYWAENCSGLYKKKGIYEALKLAGCVVKDRDYDNWKVTDSKNRLFITVFNKKGKSDCAEIIGFSVYYDTRRPDEVWDLIKDKMEKTEKAKRLLEEQNNNIK